MSENKTSEIDIIPSKDGKIIYFKSKNMLKPYTKKIPNWFDIHNTEQYKISFDWSLPECIIIFEDDNGRKFKIYKDIFDMAKNEIPKESNIKKNNLKTIEKESLVSKVRYKCPYRRITESLKKICSFLEKNADKSLTVREIGDGIGENRYTIRNNLNFLSENNFVLKLPNNKWKYIISTK